MKIVKFIFALTFALSLLMFTSNCSKGSSPGAKAYNNCLEKIAEAGRKANPGKKMPEDMQKKFAEAACKIVKTACEKDPDGPVCQKLIEKFK